MIRTQVVHDSFRTITELSDWEHFQAQPLTEPLTD